MNLRKWGIFWLLIQVLILTPAFSRGDDLYVFANGANVNGEYDSQLKIFKLCSGEIIQTNVNPKNVRVGAGNCSNQIVIASAPLTLGGPVSTMATIKTVDAAMPEGPATQVTAYLGLDTGKGNSGGVSIKLSPETLKKLLSVTKVKLTYDKNNSSEILNLGDVKFQKVLATQTNQSIGYFEELKR